LLTIVMYHYVRDLPRTPYPRIKALLTDKFLGQLDYIDKHYTVCSVDQVVAAAKGRGELPPNACLLTFDDGFIDHYETVFPSLKRRGWTAGFYPPGQCILEHKMLDVHKIHFILAAAEEPCELVNDIFGLIRPHRADHDLPDEKTLYRTYGSASRFDPPQIVFIKRILQKGLPETLRSAVVDELFRRYVSEDESAFAGQLYMNVRQLREMADAGMSIGGHGYRHLWLDSLPGNQQQREVRLTVDFLTEVYGRGPVHWVMCYPYGAYNDRILKLLEQCGCVLGLTTRVGLADLSRPLELARLDTNDLPCSADADVCDWTQRCIVQPAR